MVENNEGSSDVSHGKRKKTILFITLAVLLIGLLALILWFVAFRQFRSTDDAYVSGNKINITSAISGMPIAFFADNTDFVQEGQLLVLLDETPYKIAYEKELSELSAIVLQVKRLYASLPASLANVQVKKSQLQKATYDFENRNRLIKTKAISNEDYTHAKEALEVARQSLAMAEAEYQKATDAVGNGPIEQHPYIEKQKCLVRQAYYQLKHCAIYAPSAGHIAQRSVQIGQWVTPNSYLMALIPQNTLWVEANYKETELTNVRVGQPVKVYFDIFGSSVSFEGKVIGIASGTGSVFSIIPPQNATGNWIKIVQRLPVKISLNEKNLQKYPLRLGLSCHTTIDIRNTDLPQLSVIPTQTVQAKTSIFNIDMSINEALMEKMIKEQL